MNGGDGLGCFLCFLEDSHIPPFWLLPCIGMVGRDGVLKSLRSPALYSSLQLFLLARTFKSRIAQHPKIESVGSIGSITVCILEVANFWKAAFKRPPGAAYALRVQV